MITHAEVFLLLNLTITGFATFTVLSLAIRSSPFNNHANSIPCYATIVGRRKEA